MSRASSTSPTCPDVTVYPHSAYLDGFVVLSESEHPLGAHFVAVSPEAQDTRVAAGRSRESARMYSSAEAALPDFVDGAQSGDHSAWNIFYCLQELLQSKSAL